MCDFRAHGRFVHGEFVQNDINALQIPDTVIPAWTRVKRYTHFFLLTYPSPLLGVPVLTGTGRPSFFLSCIAMFLYAIVKLWAVTSIEAYKAGDCYSVFLEVIVWLCSLSMARLIQQQKIISHVLWTSLNNTSIKMEVTRRISVMINIFFVATVSVTLARCFTSFHCALLFAQDPRFMNLQQTIGITGICIWLLLSFIITAQSTIGILLFSVVILIQTARVASTYRYMMRDESELEMAIQRLYDIDTSLAFFSVQTTFFSSVLGCCTLLRFFLSTLILAGGPIAGINHQILIYGSLPYLVDAIFEPIALLLLFVTPPSILNQSTEYLRKVKESLYYYFFFAPCHCIFSLCCFFFFFG